MESKMILEKKNTNILNNARGAQDLFGKFHVNNSLYKLHIIIEIIQKTINMKLTEEARHTLQVISTNEW